ncbi:PH domain-containing protein, partial [Dysosmobacter welbionis]
PDIVAAKDLRQLFGIVSLIQLGAADQRDAAPHEPLVEVRPGISRAVRRDQQPGTVEPGGLHRHQLDLHRPLGQVGHRAVLRRGNGLSH